MNCSSHEEKPRADEHGHGGCLCSPSSTIKSTSKSSRKNIDKRFRDYLVRTNIDVIVIGLFLAMYHVQAADEGIHAKTAEEGVYDAHGGVSQGNNTVSAHGDEHGEGHGGHEEVYAVLFPWFAEIVGVFVYYILSRYAHAIPYTAAMFIVGTLIGISTKYLDNSIVASANTWVGIDGHVILLVFLPGLLYLDSYSIDVHLFMDSFPQLLTFAFPMVLAGTTLTALVAFYIFPYGWSLDLSMTFGAILAATDPVAVAVLLNELGAPPRLKIHVSGESLLNDGSAVVFFNIFSARFLYELGMDGVGEDIGWGEGFKLFFRLSLGGMCIGIAFGVGLLIILYNLDKRLSGEDSVVQVVATITMAYLVFFVSEILAECSGIIAVVFCGVVVKAFGETLYNDSHLSHHFWEITEYLLNTLLFALGGCVWGDIIVGSEGNSNFEVKDWGFLVVLYLLITVIRFGLVFAFYPITANIGIGTNWQEAVFMSYGGLRGAVGIALALSLHANVYNYTSPLGGNIATEYQAYTSTLFFMVGGIALLTLVINGPTSGPLLKKLGLVTPTETRKKVIENYRQQVTKYLLKEFVKLLTEERFQDIDFSVVKAHVPYLRDINYNQLMAAVKKHKDMSPSIEYKKPKLDNVIPYLYKGEVDVGNDSGHEDPPGPKPFRRAVMMENRRASARSVRAVRGNRGTVFDMRAKYCEGDVKEKRLVFIRILRTAYLRLIEQGELKARGFVAYSLQQSLDHAENAAGRGAPLSDWNALEVASNSWARPAERIMRNAFNFKQRAKRQKYRLELDLDFYMIYMNVRQIITFTHAHEWARRIFKQEFSDHEDSLTPAEKIVMDESDVQVELATVALAQLDKENVAMVKSHYACQILLNRGADYFKTLQQNGLMTAKEAGEFLEHIEEDIYDLLECRELTHAEELSSTEKIKKMTMLPKDQWRMTNLGDVSEKSDLGEIAEDSEEGVEVDEAVSIEEQAPFDGSDLAATDMEMTALGDLEMPDDMETPDLSIH